MSLSKKHFKAIAEILQQYKNGETINKETLIFPKREPAFR